MVYRTFITIVILLLSFQSGNLFGDSLNTEVSSLLTPAKLVEKYRNYLTKYNNVEITENMDTVISLSGNDTAGLSLKSHVFLAKDRVKYEILEYGNASRSVESQGEFVFDENMELTASLSNDDSRLSVVGDKSDVPRDFSERLKNVYGKLFFGVGYFGYDAPHEIESIFDVLDRTHCRFDVTYFDSSRKLTRIEAKTDKFTLNFWFDAKHNGPPYKITYDRSHETLYFDEIANFVLEVNDFRLVDDIYVPSKMTAHYVDYSSKNPIKHEVIIKDGKYVSTYQPQKLKLDNAVRRQVTQKIEWSDIKFYGQAFPDSVFTLEKLFSIPNGTSAYMTNAPQIRYVWLDGKIVPWTDEVMYAIATEGHKFMPGYSEPRFWMITISILLFALAFAKLIYDYYKNKKPK